VTFDLLVIGGGIHGVAVARDAALRGLSTLLLESGDLASGTSSRTSKLIHGGIRYLETAQIGLVREALRERAILLEMAREWVRPLPFLIPQYRGAGRAAVEIRAGLALYGLLAGRHRLAAHRALTSGETLALEPGLARDGLEGAFLYWDAQMEDARLCVAIALAAEAAGAAVRTHAPVVALGSRGAEWVARFRTADGEEEALARTVVNAAGPWAERVRALALPAGPPRMRRTRGAHVSVPALTRTHALLLTAREDGRVFFALPWGTHTLIGTTDVDEPAAPESVAPSGEDVRYLTREAARALPALDPRARPRRAIAGVRALFRGGAARPWLNTREHRVLEEGTLFTVIGGKYTTHRSLAERVVDRVVRRLGCAARPCRTASTPLPADREASVEALAGAHPGRIELGSGLALREAEAVHAALREKATRLEDFLLRRTRLWLDRDALRGAAEPAAAWMAPHLRWSAAQRAGEVESIMALLDAEERIVDGALDFRSGPESGPAPAPRGAP
jgi:glycerol-3-phosphate dehydrogenase